MTEGTGAETLHELEARIRELEGYIDLYRPQRELLQAITDSVLAGILVLDGVELRAKWANPACRRMLDEPYRTQVDIAGLRVEEFLPGVEEMGLIRLLHQVVETGQAQSDPEAEYLGFARGITYWRWSIVPLPNGPGLSADLLLVANELTEQVVSRRQVEAANAALRDSQASLAAELADTQKLQQLSSQLIREENTAGLYQQILDAAIELMHSDAGSTQAFDAETGDLRTLAWRGLDPASAAFWERVDAGSNSSCCRALQQGRRVIVQDVDTCDFMTGTEDLAHFRLSGIRSVQSTPLLARDGRVVGMLSTHWHEPHQPSERELRVLDLLARQAADLIERARTEEALHRANDTLEQRVQERTRELTASREELHSYARRLVDAIENERRNLARELHDQAGQAMAAIKLSLGQLRQEVDGPGEHATRFEEIEQLADGVMDDLHRMAMNLRPVSLDRYGLVVAMQQYIDFYRQQSGLRVDLVMAGVEEQRLTPDLETAIYRVIQEALTNVLRHAKAQRVGVILQRRNDRILAIIEDDGQGFDQVAALCCGRLGLIGMRERAEILGGHLTIESAPGKGTALYADLPYTPPEPRD